MIGKDLLHYRVTGELGAGGMGEVWRAEDHNLGLLEPGASQAVRPIRSTEFAERFATVSPDERFVAYESDETGRREIRIVVNWFAELERLAGSGGDR